MGKVNDDSAGAISLRPKARLLRTLGEELISSETVALIELVKNAYDADAKTVLIQFDGDVKAGQGSITIYDDGHGMSMDVIRDAWMVIAAPTKKINKISKSGKRRVLGEKGIGRFATSRIARELELATRVPGSPVESYAIFDWSQFDDDQLFLDEIEFLAEERSPQQVVSGWPLSRYQNSKDGDSVHGTILRMNSLKHFWDSSDFERFQRGLSRLVSPFKDVSDFHIFVASPDSVGQITTKIEAPGLIKYPHYTVEGFVKQGGDYHYSIKVEATGAKHDFHGFYYGKYTEGDWHIFASRHSISEFSEEKVRPLRCGPFSFELRIWDRDELDNVNQKIGGGIRSIRKDLDSIAGINIYRDGFRVLPYGEPDNDWLRLDIRRVQNPTKRLSNNQITGYISISADENPELHDRSNREGLDNNVAYADMQGVMMQILSELEGVRYLVRRRVESKNKGSERRGLFAEPDFSALRASLETKDLDLDQTIELVGRVESDWQKQIADFKEVLSRYHALATLGGIVDKVLHDGRQPLATIQTEAGLSQELIEDLGTNAANSEVGVSQKTLKSIGVSFQKIVRHASVLKDVFNRIEPFGGRKRGRPRKYYIEELIRDVFQTYRKELSEGGISVELPETQTLVSVDVTELSEIFVNLILNSVYWLGSVPKNDRYIRVLVNRVKEGELEILFSDSGPGVDSKYRDHIFDPYFSTRPDGHGLGLCLIGEIVKDYYNGSVELMDTGGKGGAMFRILLRRRV